MPFLGSQLSRVEPYYLGDKPLPRRLERLARMVADDVLTNVQIAERAGVSRPSVVRFKAHPAFRSRVAYLRERAAEAALADEPLAQKGQRIALAGRMARTLNEQLEANGYVTTLGVSKQGNPIVGFDRARVAEIRQYLSLIADELEDKHAKASTDNLAVSVTMTTADAVTKVQALLSRTAEGQAPGMPPAGGVEGGMSGAGNDRIDGAVLDTEYNVISDAKGEGE